MVWVTPTIAWHNTYYEGSQHHGEDRCQPRATEGPPRYFVRPTVCRNNFYHPLHWIVCRKDQWNQFGLEKWCLLSILDEQVSIKRLWPQYLPLCYRWVCYGACIIAGSTDRNTCCGILCICFHWVSARTFTFLHVSMSFAVILSWFYWGVQLCLCL